MESAGRGTAQRPTARPAAGEFVAAPAEMLCHRRDLHFSSAAETDAVALIGKFTKEDGDLHISHGERVVDQTLAIFFAGAKTLHLFLRNPDPGQRTFAMQVGERSSE